MKVKQRAAESVCSGSSDRIYLSAAAAIFRSCQLGRYLKLANRFYGHWNRRTCQQAALGLIEIIGSVNSVNSDIQRPRAFAVHSSSLISAGLQSREVQRIASVQWQIEYAPAVDDIADLRVSGVDNHLSFASVYRNRFVYRSHLKCDVHARGGSDFHDELWYQHLLESLGFDEQRVCSGRDFGERECAII